MTFKFWPENFTIQKTKRVTYLGEKSGFTNRQSPLRAKNGPFIDSSEKT